MNSAMIETLSSCSRRGNNKAHDQPHTKYGLVSSLKKCKAIQSREIETVMLDIDLADFNPEEPFPYMDKSNTPEDALVTPQIFARSLEVLLPVFILKGSATCLQIGSSSPVGGYMTACMASLVGPLGKVVSLQNNQWLVQGLRQKVSSHHPDLLRRIDLTLDDDAADGRGPFDCIYSSRAYPSVPDQLLKSLKIGGIMLIPITVKEKIYEYHVFTQVVKDARGNVNVKKVMRTPMHGLLSIDGGGRHEKSDLHRYY